jgi:predicted acetyltransferase
MPRSCPKSDDGWHHGRVTDRIVLRSPTAAEFPRFVAPLSIAFNHRMSDAEIENELHTAELDRFVGALEGESVVGCAGAFSFGMSVPGGQVPVAGLTAVGVLPTHTRRGILRQMMTWIFDQARERHEPIAILWASEAAIYQRFGYGPGTQQSFFEAPRDKIRFVQPIESPGRMRIVDLDEAERTFPPLFEGIRPGLPGAITRNEARWRWEFLADHEWHRHGNGEMVRALLEIDGQARGYTTYRQLSDWDRSGPKGVLTVTEVLGLDAAAEQTIWQWLFGIDLIGTVRGWRGPVPHPLQLMITEPRRLAMTTNDGMWLRIIDLPKALEARSFDGPGRIVLQVSDDFCPANAGTWQLDVPGDGARRAVVTPAAPEADVDLSLDIGALAAVYLGAFRFRDLLQAGRATECRPDAIARADALFVTTQAPSNTTMF